MNSLIISRRKNGAMKNSGPIFVRLALQLLHHNRILELEEFPEFISDTV